MFLFVCLYHHSEWQKKREEEKLERERLAKEAAEKGKPLIMLISDDVHVLSSFCCSVLTVRLPEIVTELKGHWAINSNFLLD